MKKLYRLLLVGCLLFSFTSSYASHIAGGDIYYQWVSGNTYKVSIVIYGDCAGGAYSTLDSAKASVDVYDGTTLYNTYLLPLQSKTQVPVTSATDSAMTICHGGTLLGISAYLFSAEITLPHTSANWNFLYSGWLTSYSGQWVYDITNLVSTSTLGLRATLDNTTDSLSSPVFLDYPLFIACVNQSVSYCSFPHNIYGDSMNTVLISAVESPASGIYNSGYSALHPVSAPDINMDTTYGILSFTPDIIQRSAIEEQIKQYRHGRLVSSVTRAWAIAVGSTPINKITAKIGNVYGDVIKKDTTYVQVYMDTATISYQVLCDNPDSNNITIQIFKIPQHAIFTVGGYGSKSPSAKFIWKPDSAAIGPHYVLIKVADDGSPYPASYTQIFRMDVLKPTAVSELNVDNKLSIYPNPATKYIKLQGIKAGKFKLTILRSDGAMVKSINDCHAGIPIDISSFAPGLYCLVAYAENGTSILKGTFVKK